ncbi:hypothetical protein D3C85_1666250 [compost metagenome]
MAQADQMPSVMMVNRILTNQTPKKSRATPWNCTGKACKAGASCAGGGCGEEVGAEPDVGAAARCC